ncbi:hypothetical protein CRE_03093 [Caenorhabditis remanei]|uniref:Skp1-related protein n=1 Tax=Caenorhabditis remanei TaxID=31234 RepID=E3LWI2_CAERE|nr:hypothetical protein CRE_03093 [Caenorhabditis remanei]
MSAEQAPADVHAVDAPVAEAAPAEPTVYITLESHHGMEVKISSLALKQSKTLADLVSNLHGGEDPHEAIPVADVTKDTLVKIVQWCEKHAGEPRLPDDFVADHEFVIPEWDQEFLDIDNDVLFELMLASNYLNIKKLSIYGMKKVALMAKGKSPEELRELYAIPTDEQDEVAEARARARAAARAAARAGDGTGDGTGAEAAGAGSGAGAAVADVGAGAGAEEAVAEAGGEDAVADEGAAPEDDAAQPSD